MRRLHYEGKSLLQLLLQYTKVDIQSECLIWQGPVDKDGYAYPFRGKGRRLAKQVYEYFSGKKLHKGLIPDHLCENPACVNFFHLEPVTIGENLQRYLNNHPKTRCIRGHLFTTENTYIDKQGKRSCKLCRKKRNDYFNLVRK